MEYLKNENIRLRNLEPEDLDALYRWENNTAWWDVGNTLKPYSRYALKEYISESSKDIYESRQLRLMIELTGSNKTIGTLDLFDFEPHHRRAGVGILVDAEYQRAGWATQSLSLLLDYAFSFLKIHSLYAHIPVGNQPSIDLFMRCGFCGVGILSEWQMTPAGWVDVLLMQRVNKAE